MSVTLPPLGLPLLTKELVEQAARRRTYIVRVVYAALLFLAGFAFYYQLANRYSSSVFAILGQGRQLFEQIVMVQFMGIYIFMPAMTCGVLTVEKERSSLGLLFLTRLGPWAILIEKFLGRVIPMFTFLLLSLPLLVIAYSLGGISQKFLWSGVWFLVLATFQVGALALLCSAYFRTTVGAFMATYLLGLVMLFGLPMVNEILNLHLERIFQYYFLNSGTPMAWNAGGQWVPLMFVAPAIFEITGRSGASFWELAFASLPILCLTMTMLVLSRVFVVRRAFAPPGNVILKVLKWLDAFFTQLNDNRWTQGKVLLSDKVALNTITEPVAWRETTKTSLGALRYLVRLFLLMEAPIATIGLLSITSNGSPEPLTIMLLLAWVVVTLMIAVKATTLVAGERSHETLDVLLTTPMRSDEIVKQKFRGVTRLMWVLSVPLLTCIFLKVAIVQGGGGYRRYGYYENRGDDWVVYMVCAVLEVIVYLPMVAWLALLIGMHVRSQNKAIFITLATLVAWCLLPVFFFMMLLETFNWDHGLAQLWFLTSPATIIPFNEYFELREFELPWLAVILNFLLYTLILFVLRALCLSNLDQRLGRAAGDQR